MRYPERLEINRWHFILSSQRSWFTSMRGWHEFDFAIFYLNSYPPEGSRPTRDNYTGFWIRVYYWLPFEILNIW